MLIEAQLRPGHSEREAYELRKVKHRHLQLLAEIELDLLLKTVQHGVAERAWRHQRLRAV